MREALPYQVQDAIPIPVEEAVLDYVPLEEFGTPDGDLMLSILVVAAQREMVEALVGSGPQGRACRCSPSTCRRSAWCGRPSGPT